MQKKDKSSSSRREDTSSRRDADSRRSQSPSGRREEISDKDLKKTSGGGTKAENDKLGKSQQRSQQRFSQ